MRQKQLTYRQRIFCSEYIKDWNSTRSAISAGYSRRSARQIASRLLTFDNVKAYIESIQKDIEKQAGISQMKVLQEYMKLAFNSIAHLHNTWIDRKDFEKLTGDQKSCISEIDTKVVKRAVDKEVLQVEQVKIKLFDKQRALESICKMLGYNAPDQSQIKHDHNFDSDPFKEIRKNAGIETDREAEKSD